MVRPIRLPLRLPTRPDPAARPAGMDRNGASGARRAFRTGPKRRAWPETIRFVRQIFAVSGPVLYDGALAASASATGTADMLPKDRDALWPRVLSE